MPNKHGEFVWYELITADAAKAKAFYDSVVGWNIGTESVPTPGVDYRMIVAPDGMAGGVLTMTEDMVSHGAKPGWFGYFGVDDVDRTAEAIVADGGAVQLPPTDTPGVGRLAMVTDAQGVPIYLMRGASDDVSTAFQRMGMGHVSWNELQTGDDAAALAFYDKHFNIKKIGAMPMGEMRDYSFIANDGKTGENDAIGAVMKAPPGAPTGWKFYFRVPAIDAAKAKVEAGGGTVLHDPMQVPGGEWVISAIDPEGVAFGLVAPER